MTAEALLLTQADATELASGSLHALLASVDVASSLAELDCRVVVVLRGVGAEQASSLLADHAALQLVHVPERTSLSGCRNAGLSAAHEDLGDDTIVGFPDDDLSFTAGLLRRARNLLGPGGADVVVGRYAPDEEMSLDDLGITPGRVSGRDLARLSSNAFFLRGAVVRSVGGFNPTIGAGTAIPAGEDLDLLLRADRAGAHVVHDPGLRFLHELRQNPRYVVPGIVVLLAHVLDGRRDLRVHVLRCVLHALRAVLTGALPKETLAPFGPAVAGRTWRTVAHGWSTRAVPRERVGVLR